NLKPLYIKATIDGIHNNKFLVDTGTTINISPYFFGKITKANGMLPIEIKVGSNPKATTFFVADANYSYNVLLGGAWIHSNLCVPCTLHQKLFLWNNNQVKVIFVGD
ncbi:hypothetical protein CFOL_v3_31471, partial [Cephalotus follicularis]